MPNSAPQRYVATSQGIKLFHHIQICNVLQTMRSAGYEWDVMSLSNLRPLATLKNVPVCAAGKSLLLLSSPWRTCCMCYSRNHGLLGLPLIPRSVGCPQALLIPFVHASFPPFHAICRLSAGSASFSSVTAITIPDDQAVWISFQADAREFFSSSQLSDGLWEPILMSYVMSTSCFSGDNAAGAWSWPLKSMHSVKVKSTEM
jgi:hypothetical protein